MTILNAWSDGAQLLVAADTEMVCNVPGQGPVALQTSKLLALPHLPAIFGGRGSMDFTATAFLGALHAGGDIEKMVEGMPTILARVFDDLAPHFPAMPEEQSILLAGWSPARRRMIVYTFEQQRRGDGFKPAEQPVPGLLVQPWQHQWGAPPDCGKVPGMIRAARFQRDRIKEHDRNAAGGGALVAAHVTPKGISMARVHEFR